MHFTTYAEKKVGYRHRKQAEEDYAKAAPFFYIRKNKNTMMVDITGITLWYLVLNGWYNDLLWDSISCSQEGCRILVIRSLFQIVVVIEYMKCCFMHMMLKGKGGQSPIVCNVVYCCNKSKVYASAFFSLTHSLFLSLLCLCIYPFFLSFSFNCHTPPKQHSPLSFTFLLYPPVAFPGYSLS